MLTHFKADACRMAEKGPLLGCFLPVARKPSATYKVACLRRKQAFLSSQQPTLLHQTVFNSHLTTPNAATVQSSGKWLEHGVFGRHCRPM